MSHISVLLKLDSIGTMVTVPAPVVVAPGDTVEWHCDEGDVTVSFDSRALFDGEHRFSGHKGEKTKRAKVRLDVARGKHFDCTVVLNGKVVNKAYGIDTSGAGD